MLKTILLLVALVLPHRSHSQCPASHPEDQICSVLDDSSTDWPHLITMAAKYSEISMETPEETDDDEESYSPPTPRIRSPLARAMYDRMREDRRHQGREHTEWYALETSTYPEEVKALFLQCYQDRGTLSFLENCYEKSDWVLTQMYHGFMKSVLTWFMTVTSANAFLGRGSMFVFSKDQFQRLMKVDDQYKAKSMIDLGAGDGKVTRMMADFYEEVYATEVSSWMQSRLKNAGYKVLTIEEWPERQYDLISCLNLLDRCDRPLSLLEEMKRSLAPGGRIVVALVLPYVPYVETVRDHLPQERLPVQGRTFSEQVLSLVQHVFQPAGYDVISFTRLPYLCEGDIYKSFYVLNDAVFVLKVREETERVEIGDDGNA